MKKLTSGNRVVFLRKANKDDIFKISELYYEVYSGTYSDPLMTDLNVMRRFILNSNNYWIVAKDGQKIIGSLIYEYDPTHKLTKAFGAVVDNAYRGFHLSDEMMIYGIEMMKEERGDDAVDVAYATTRTVHKAAQLLTQKMGYHNLGIFPNVHRTTQYETHCLAASYTESALKKRFTDFTLHPKVAPLFKIVSKEMGLPSLKLASIKRPSNRPEGAKVRLEVIDGAPHFVHKRFDVVKEQNKISDSFFPFHMPNYLITDPDRNIEIFLFINQSDRHCVIIGKHVEDPFQYTDVMIQVTEILRSLSVRYIEKIIRADQTELIDDVLKARFIPCAYFPAFQLAGDTRYDFVVFSRSFETFDFSTIQLEGTNQDYLRQYYESWKEISLNPKLIRE